MVHQVRGVWTGGFTKSDGCGLDGSPGERGVVWMVRQVRGGVDWVAQQVRGVWIGWFSRWEWFGFGSSPGDRDVDWRIHQLRVALTGSFTR